MERIGQLTARQREDALLWLAGYAPAVFDEVTSAVEPFPGDGTEDPAPFCGQCGADIGVFLKLGLDWWHYRATSLEDVELFDPGHAPVLARRVASAPPGSMSPPGRSARPGPGVPSEHA